MANITCSVCLEPMIQECDIFSTPCLHPFHIICMTHLLKTPLYLVGSKLLFKTANKIGNFNKKFRESDSDSPDENKESKESWEIDFENQKLETVNKIHLEGAKKFENVEKINIGKWSEDFLKSPELACMKNFYENQLLKPDFVTISSTLEDPISSISNSNHDFKSTLYWKQGMKSHAPAGQTKASQVKVVESANYAKEFEEFEKEINQMKFTDDRLKIADILNILNDKYLKYLNLNIIF